MAFSATVHRVLLSAPSDVEAADLQAINESIGRWNFLYGPGFASNVMPVEWRLHSTSEYGDRPQGSLNRQLVDEVDFIIAVFWHRLGSPTGAAISGTVEEIESVAARGGYVAVLRCMKPVPIGSSLEQQVALENYLSQLRPKALIMTYQSDSELRQHTDTILTRVVTRRSTTMQVSAAVGPGTVSGALVTASVVSDEGSAGRPTSWHLVLNNAGDAAAWNITYSFTAGFGEMVPMIRGQHEPIELLGAGDEVRIELLMHPGVAQTVGCAVRWEGPDGANQSDSVLSFF